MLADMCMGSFFQSSQAKTWKIGRLSTYSFISGRPALPNIMKKFPVDKQHIRLFLLKNGNVSVFCWLILVVFSITQLGKTSWLLDPNFKNKQSNNDE